VNPSRLFIERPIATALLMLAILVLGIVGYIQLPVSALPQADYPTIQVVTFYPGASPDVMASAVTAPLERQFGQVAGLSQMTSTSSDGSSIVVLQFGLDVNIDVAEQEIQAAINAAQSYLPTDLPAPPVYNKSNPADAPVLTLALTSTTIPLSKVEDLVDTRLAPKISQLSGVGLVSISGGQKPAIRIQANPAAMASYGVNMEDLRTVLSNASVNSAKGIFDGAAQAFQINANDQLLSSAGYRDVIVAYKNGAPVMLTDVAKISDSVENANLAAWMNQTPAVIINIQRQPGANTIAVVDTIKALLPKLQATLPAAVTLTVLTDRTVTIRASVKDVQFELVLTIVLVIAVIFIFLRSLTATLIPSVAVPISLIGTFAVMNALGYSINNLTMMAFTISTGFVVDDAIVMVENISRYIEEGMAPLEAALNGAKQIGFTIITLTTSLIAVLIPLLFMGAIVGRLLRELAVTLSVTILISGIVSLTLTPMMAARILRKRTEAEQTTFYRRTGLWLERLIDAYDRSLHWVLRRQRTGLFVALSMLVLTVILYMEIPKGFFPVQDTGVIQGITHAPESSSFAAMSRKQQLLSEIILKDPAVASLSSFIGADGTNTTLNEGRLQINLTPIATRHASAAQVIDRLNTAVKQVTGIHVFLQPIQDLTVDDRVSKTQYQYTLEDPDGAELSQWTERLVDVLRKEAAVTGVATDEQRNGISARLTIDRATAARLNISPDVIDSTLYDAFGQRQVSTLFTQSNQYHVILETLPEFRQDAGQLGKLYIQGSTVSAAAASSPGRTGVQSNGSVTTLSGSSSTGNSSVQSSILSSSSGLALAGSASNSLASSSSASSNLVLSATTPTSGMTTPSTASPTASNTGRSGSSAGTGSTATSGGQGQASSSALSTPVPLSAFTHVALHASPMSIVHQGQFPAVTVSFNQAVGHSLGQAVDAVERAVASLHMPASVQTSFQGSAAAFRDIGSNEVWLIMAALLAVYIVLGILYESFIHPVTILSTLPSAGVGALLALRVTGHDLDLIAVIGIILLIGIVQKNGIIIVDFALDAERHRGLSAQDAVAEASRLRFRPILMTTLSALFAGLPLALGSGIGAELRRPLGIAMVGGLLVSQVLTLYTTPLIYIYFDRLAQRWMPNKLPPARAPATAVG
jgi:multidrug efflux pump